MTVGEANEKVCSFMSGQVGNAIDIGISFQTCICSDCMAWEYTKQHSETETEQYVVKDGDRGYSRTRAKELPENEKQGYCKRLNPK